MTFDPCKFCGSKAAEHRFEPRKGLPRFFFVTCLSCGAQGPFVGCDSPEDAMAAWNRTPEEWEQRREGGRDD